MLFFSVIINYVCVCVDQVNCNETRRHYFVRSPFACSQLLCAAHRNRARVDRVFVAVISNNARRTHPFAAWYLRTNKRASVQTLHIDARAHGRKAASAHWAAEKKNASSRRRRNVGPQTQQLKLVKVLIANRTGERPSKRIVLLLLLLWRPQSGCLHSAATAAANAVECFRRIIVSGGGAPTGAINNYAFIGQTKAHG